ncbi:MAG: hypothetical protein AMXMBFR4_19650 [Candidatus Hydrogenedentota bacterium]
MRELTQLMEQLRAMMDDVRGTPYVEHLRSATWQPPVDVYEAEDCVIVVVELPGVDKQDIDLVVLSGVLRITGVRKKPLPENTRHVYQLEIPYGRFARFLKLPCGVDDSGIRAEYREGYLVVHCPRSSTDE